MKSVWRSIKSTIDEAKTPITSEHLSWDDMTRITIARFKVLALITVPHVLLFAIVLAVGWIARRCQ